MTISIITNGLLLTPEIVDRLLPFGLQRRRRSRSTATARRTTACVRCAAARAPSTASSRTSAASPAACRIAIGGNFDESSVDSYPALLEFLRAQEFADKLVKVNFKPVVRDASPPTPKGMLAADAGRRRAASRSAARA